MRNHRGLFQLSLFFQLEDHQDEFYILLSVAVLGALVMVSNSHFITTFLGMETLSVCLYGMVAYPLHEVSPHSIRWRRVSNTLCYRHFPLVLSCFGIALLYAQTGTLQFF